MLSRLHRDWVLVLTGALLWSAAGAGCVTPAPSYVVTLNDGRVYRSAQAPAINPKTGYYKFRDRYGQDVLLRDREVASIARDPAN